MASLTCHAYELAQPQRSVPGQTSVVWEPSNTESGLYRLAERERMARLLKTEEDHEKQLTEICPFRSNYADWTHILRCDGTKAWREGIPDKWCWCSSGTGTRTGTHYIEPSLSWAVEAHSAVTRRGSAL
jgi:hypothetical protein